MNPSSSSEFSSDHYFKTQSPPPTLSEEINRVKQFVLHHVQEDRRVVLITSGGTTVPLEHNVVRFLDNFSAGTRGSASAEYFLRSNRYAVIFLYRSHSLQPFSRCYSHSTHPFLDLLHLPHETNLPTGPATISVTDSEMAPLAAVLRAYHTVREKNLLLTIPFVTVNEYLWLLRSVARVMGEPSVGLGRSALLYLAAAVSDFFIPEQKLSEHKIQSGKGSLVLEMDAVPKVLKDLAQEWTNQAYTVSFKLETDQSLLIPKAQAALERYGHQLVIANELHTRKHQVIFVMKNGQIERIGLPQFSSVPVVGTNPEGRDQVEIEDQIVERLIIRHDQWISLQ
ncbi:uncharacterized protein MELLADRAFT_38628 [Melampsora larici-populina 98AG31]|uniref:DNA/pantothenate metabolism flavoprotein C-terminal domain-containing protein n=1 Tax=Melampsora larici-populina (strain 98AG31 / pathotype 3-4-7) TaxID=747676 RepID=F4RZ61_MELLP|nr:uncharacterized protein MELLADRAFT_38628 [Melampsora larici-populina 98AG31]EGG02372.1 hypothetical protein MELLADRAFT_38628 [Melampsora larici-populina 98AG31]